MKSYYHLIKLITVQTIFFSCQVKSPQKPIARVHDKYLYEEEIASVIPPNTSPNDSVRIVQSYIQNWVQQNLILNKAELNLPEDLKNMEKQLEDYRNSLIIYAYEKELVKQKLDTIVSENEIENYYKQNSAEFELKDYIVKVLYMKLEKDSPELNKARKWFRSENSEDFKKLEEYSRKFAINFLVDTTAWLYFEELLREIPIETYNKADFLKNNRFVEFQNSGFLYFLHIMDYRLKDDISPLSLVENNIRSIILNKRKISLIETMRKDIYEDAQKRGNFEIY